MISLQLIYDAGKTIEKFNTNSFDNLTKEQIEIIKNHSLYETQEKNHYEHSNIEFTPRLFFHLNRFRTVPDHIADILEDRVILR